MIVYSYFIFKSRSWACTQGYYLILQATCSCNNTAFCSIFSQEFISFSFTYFSFLYLKILKIINATIENLDEIYALICQLEDEQFNKDSFSKIFRENLLNPDVFYQLAVENGCVVGFISLRVQELLHHAAKIAEIQELVISKNHQGAGIGSALFYEAVKIASQYKCEQLEVCCHLERERAHQFYLAKNMNKSHYKFTLPINANALDSKERTL